MSRVDASPRSPRVLPPRVLVWDVPVRVFHWLLVASVGTAWVTGGDGSRLHEIAGYVATGLIAFRLIWGAIGTRRARFADFVVGPLRLFRYLRDLLTGRAGRYLGHNPAGGAMILALIGGLVVTCVTGILQMTHAFFGIAWVEQVHHWAATIVMCLVPLHVLGALASSVLHRENLIGAMFSGLKRLDIPGHPLAAEVQAPRRVDLRDLMRGANGFSFLSLVLVASATYGWHATSGRTASAPVDIVAAQSTAPATPPDTVVASAPAPMPAVQIVFIQPPMIEAPVAPLRAQPAWVAQSGSGKAAGRAGKSTRQKTVAAQARSRR